VPSLVYQVSHHCKFCYWYFYTPCKNVFDKVYSYRFLDITMSVCCLSKFV